MEKNIWICYKKAMRMHISSLIYDVVHLVLYATAHFTYLLMLNSLNCHTFLHFAETFCEKVN